MFYSTPMAKKSRTNSLADARAKGSAKSAANSKRARIEVWSTTDYLVYWDGERRVDRLSELSMADTDQLRKVLCGGRDYSTHKEYFRRRVEQESTHGVSIRQRVPHCNHGPRARSTSRDRPASISGQRGARFARRTRSLSPEIARQHRLSAAARPGQPHPDLNHVFVYNYVNQEFYSNARTGRFKGDSSFYRCNCDLLGDLEKETMRADGAHLLCFFQSHGGMNERGETYLTRYPNSTCRCTRQAGTNFGKIRVSEIVNALRKVTTGATVVLLCCRLFDDPTRRLREAVRRASSHINVIWVCAPGEKYTAGHPQDAYKETILKAFEETRTPYEAIDVLNRPRQDPSGSTWRKRRIFVPRTSCDHQSSIG